MKNFLRSCWDYLSEKWHRLTGGWEPFVEKPLPADELHTVMQQASIPSWGFFFMLILSSAIATFGLLSNSAPAIIGAMIIAPLMGPMMGLAYGIVIFRWGQISRSILTVTSGAALVVLFAYLTTIWIGWRLAGSEILSRTTPTLLDLGVAMAAGAAAAFAYSRRSIMNSIAGVAIAVALVPPLAVCGIGLALGRKATADVGLSLTELGLYSGGSDIASGAFILFLANLAGIVVVAGTVLLTQGYGHWKKAIAGIVLVAAVSALLLEPLGESLHRLHVKSRTMRLIARETLPTSAKSPNATSPGPTLKTRVRSSRSKRSIECAIRKAVCLARTSRSGWATANALSPSKVSAAEAVPVVPLSSAIVPS